MRDRARLFTPILCLALLLCACAVPAGGAARRYEAVWYDLFDTVTTLRGYAASQREFNAAAEAIYGTLLEYHRLCDIYHDYAGLSNLKTVNDRAGGEPVETDRKLLELLEYCRELCGESGGAVDVTLGPVLALWHTARETGTPPEREALERAAEHTGFGLLELDPAAGTVRLTDPEARLDLGAVAKGWASQQAMGAAPEGYLLSAGGNICVSGTKPGGEKWVVAIENPDGDAHGYLHTLETGSGSVVTSGDYQRYFTGPDGVRYHHIIDPETLCPGTRWRAVSVLCPDSGIADGLSTALFLLDREAGEALTRAHGAEALWVAADGSESMTAGFRAALRDGR